MTRVELLRDIFMKRGANMTREELLRNRGPLPCRSCGEMIPHPMPIALGKNYLLVVCADCSGETHRLIPPRNKTGSEAADIQYHGGMFYSGEW